jgi:hypothetical protein
MNWQNKYYDFSTKQKRVVRQKAQTACEISKATFYNLLNGKQNRRVITQQIEQIILTHK